MFAVGEGDVELLVSGKKLVSHFIVTFKNYEKKKVGLHVCILSLPPSLSLPLSLSLSHTHTHTHTNIHTRTDQKVQNLLETTDSANHVYVATPDVSHFTCLEKYLDSAIVSPVPRNSVRTLF